MIEMSLHTVDGLGKHQEGTADGMTANLASEHHHNIHNAMEELKRRLHRLPLQLYVQGAVMTDLLGRVLSEANCYYAQRQPAELSRFEWVIDAKGNGSKLTEWEDWWTPVFMPHMQSQSLRGLAFKLVEADYSHFWRFETDLPDYLLPHTKDRSSRETSMALRTVFE